MPQKNKCAPVASSKTLEVGLEPVVTGFVGWQQMHVQVVTLHYVRLIADVAAV